MFSEEFQQNLKINHSNQGVIDFLEGDFSYYADLYVKLSSHLQNESEGGFAFNRLNDIDGVLLLGLATCQKNDQSETTKIHRVAQELDRLFSLLQLQGIYESNKFQEAIHKIAEKIRNSDISSMRSAFDDELKIALSDKLPGDIEEPLNYMLFKTTGSNLNPTFKRYFFARIEGFLAEHLQTRMRHGYNDLVKSKGAKNGFHIEHILSNNEENKSYFPDEEVFWNERNRLGGLLLLKGKDNISSNNECYQQKLDTYASTLLWNESLRQDFYKSNLDCKKLKKDYGLDNLKAIDKFDADALESRHHLLFEIAKIIWA